MGKYIDHRLVARPEPDNTFWDDSTGSIPCMMALPDSCESRSEPARARPGLKSRAFGVGAAKCRAGPDEARPDRRKPDADSGY